jgi:hypothetical protein
MRNYVINGDFRARNKSTPIIRADAASKGIVLKDKSGATITTDGVEIFKYENVANVGPVHGFAPGMGGGPGGGATANFTIEPFATWGGWSDHPIPHGPYHKLSVAWTVLPLDSTNGPASGWNDPTKNRGPTLYPFRYDFLEWHFKGATELIGSTVEYSFWCAIGAQSQLTIYPGIWMNYAPGDFDLFDTGQNQALVPGVPNEVWGSFRLPEPPAGKVIDDAQFYVGFSVGAITPNPPPLWVSDVRFCRQQRATRNIDHTPVGLEGYMSRRDLVDPPFPPLFERRG